MNEPIRTPRSFATLSLPVAEMRAVGKALGGTLNDVAATITDEGLQRYLGALGKSPTRPLVAMCPVSLREEGDREATTKVTAMHRPCVVCSSCTPSGIVRTKPSGGASRDCTACRWLVSCGPCPAIRSATHAASR